MSTPLPNDQATLAQRSRIMRELSRLRPGLPYEEESPWIAELNTLCNLNIGDLTELSKSEASQVIDKLIKL